MGGAMVAIAEGPEAMYYNPSAAALSPNATAVQVSNLDTQLYVNGVNWGPVGMSNMMGFNYRFFRDRVGVGLLMPMGASGGGPLDPGTGFQLPIGTLLGEVPAYSWPMYGGPTIPIKTGLAFRLHDTLAIGIEQSIRTHGMLRLSSLNFDLDAILAGFLGIDLKAGQITGQNYHLHSGVASRPMETGYSLTFRPVKYVSVGYSWTDQSVMDLWVPVTISSALLEYDLIMILVTEVEAQPEIERLGIGVHIPVPRSQLTLAYSQDTWKYGNLYEDRMDDYMRYSRNIRFGAGDQSIAWPKPSPRKNVTTERYGLEYLLKLKGWVPDFISKRNPVMALRGGYFKWESPYPEDALYGGGFDSDADVKSGGLGIKFDRKNKSQVMDPGSSRWISVDLHFQYFELEERDYKRTYDEWGNPIAPDSNYYWYTEGEITNVGAQVTWWH
jgi:hypothetical protein